MGEWSKKIGEKGEEIVDYFFKEILGYNSVLAGESIKCIKGEKHKVSKSDKTTHGIDGLISTKSPLEDNILDIGVISSKFTSKEYPNSPKSKFKEHIVDLAHTLECFKFSKLYAETNKKYTQIDRTNVTGILVWTSNGSPETESIIPKVSNSLLDNDLIFEKIIVIDNDRINFYVETVLNAKEKFGEKNVQFIYHNTNLNNSSLPTNSYGTFLPINYIFSNLIPLRIENGNNIDLVLFSKDNFDIENFSQLLAFVKNFDHLDSTQRVIISYPEFNELIDTPGINSVLSDFNHYKLNKNLFVRTHLSNFKNLS